jgi:uncharacterized membrane protein (UPF0127 family)
MIVHVHIGTLVLPQVEISDDPPTGLIGRESMTYDGMLFFYSGAFTTVGMLFSIDMVFVNSGRVMSILRNVPPGVVNINPAVHSVVLETAAGMLRNVTMGNWVSW